MNKTNKLSRTFKIEGGVFLILGVLAILFPIISTLSVQAILSWIFIFGGIIQIYRHFQLKGHESEIPSLILALISLLCGLFLLFFPVTGLLSLTAILTTLFILEGITKIYWGIQTWSSWLGSGWLITSGTLSLLMAAIIISGWPETAFWVIGLLVGINMFFFGTTLLYLGFNQPDSTLEE